MIYVWADTHFNHVGIIRHCARPYADVAAMNLDLINRWNSVVGENDDVYLLGDFGFKAKGGDDLRKLLSLRQPLAIPPHLSQGPETTKGGTHAEVDTDRSREQLASRSSPSFTVGRVTGVHE